ncbi:uracil-DNA glycosylase [Pseudoduganella aquatica]|uniref:Type-4 uracil-DNA glycosylase n=1 Tax=Pseudoduganella aquatica TaxID=2660641 RepID=A0A7X4HCR7_9BURK|nr:uracil-DNA glycosylase [Pseudoduganella aquatica]MYN07850.1 uracil-DNA glycosylase [Pseudoduganella aquatica]
MNRNEVFLQEMGVGVQWRLRNPVASMDDVDAPEVEAFAAEPEPAPHAAPPPVFAPAPIEVAPVAAVAAQPQPPAASPAPAAPPAADADNAWFDNTPLPATPPPTVTKSPAKPVQPAPPRPQGAGAEEPESTAWFDDVPVPEASVPAVHAPQAAGQQIADMDWPALQAAVATCTRCDLCHSRQAAVPGRGDPRAQWLVLGTAPGAADEQEVRAITGEPGQLLDNMLKAISVAPEEDAYVTTLVKCRPPVAEDGSDSLPTAEQLAACRPYLQRELELAGSRMIVTLGHTAGKGLLGAAARGKVLRYDGIPTIATYHPADLLRKPADKAKAWSDLCLAKAAHAGRA